MNFDIDFIKAETHSPEYLMHKYWARKPHNVINHCIRSLMNNNGIIIDPFCGSGVVLHEGAILGHTCYGYDINPSATLISSVLIDPPTKESFMKVFSNIYDVIYEKYGYLYETTDGKIIKYLSHRIISNCECGKKISQDIAIKNGKKYTCPFCKKQIRFNLESMTDSEIFKITVDKQKNYTPSALEIKIQKEKSEFLDKKINYKKYDYQFPENRRILAFEGISTKHFFTNRNFTILCAFLEMIYKISDIKIRNCALLLLTASAAQCSKLIAHRNDLSTGGPAWSVPGFWVPQEHLETNPFVHISARIKKFEKALDTLNSQKKLGNSKVYEGDSLKELSKTDIKADLIFLDPPYGDNIPYTEFSNIWNSFLMNIPNSNDDISVSDRINKSKSWDNYASKLNLYMDCFKKHLKKDGKLLITFNNNDMKAWISLIASLQNNHFICKNVYYQIPAVISSKAQMSINTSYISDVYSVYVYSETSSTSRDLSKLTSHLCFIANARNGKISKIVLDREFILCWLRENIDYSLLKTKETVINSLFSFDKKSNQYTLKKEFFSKTQQLKESVHISLNKILKHGPETIVNCYSQVSKDCVKFGIMELSEFKEIISSYAIQDGLILGDTTISS